MVSSKYYCFYIYFWKFSVHKFQNELIEEAWRCFLCVHKEKHLGLIKYSLNTKKKQAILYPISLTNNFHLYDRACSTWVYRDLSFFTIFLFTRWGMSELAPMERRKMEDSSALSSDWFDSHYFLAYFTWKNHTCQPFFYYVWFPKNEIRFKKISNPHLTMKNLCSFRGTSIFAKIL